MKMYTVITNTSWAEFWKLGDARRFAKKAGGIDWPTIRNSKGKYLKTWNRKKM